MVWTAEAGMTGQSWKDSGKDWCDGELESRDAEYSAPSGAPAAPRIPIDLDETSWTDFQLRPPPGLMLPGAARPGESRALDSDPRPSRGEDPYGALTLLALGAPGLLDWRRKREASPRA